MSVRIRVSDSDVQRQRVTLGGVPFELRLTWRNGPAAWYLSVFDVEGEPVLLGARLIENWVAGRSARRRLRGMFAVIGVPTRESLPDSAGGECSLLWASEEDIAAAAPPRPLFAGEGGDDAPSRMP